MGICCWSYWIGGRDGKNYGLGVARPCSKNLETHAVKKTIQAKKSWEWRLETISIITNIHNYYNIILGNMMIP